MKSHESYSENNLFFSSVTNLYEFAILKNHTFVAIPTTFIELAENIFLMSKIHEKYFFAYDFTCIYW